MDDQQTYLLNGLIARQFELGRIARFRKVPRGRQAETFELLTSQHNEFLVALYPPGFTAGQLNFAATTINMLDKERFSVVPMLPVKPAVSSGGFAAEGPQGSSMLISLAPSGSPLPPDQYTEHDISQLGLRLAWLHRLFAEHLPAPSTLPPLAERLQQTLASPPPHLDHLLDMLHILPSPGWAHGDIQPAAILFDSDHQLCSLVDFALLHFGSPLEDLVDAFLTITLDAAGAVQSPSLSRSKALLESYDSLSPIRQTPWTSVVAAWCAQRLMDAAQHRRSLPRHFAELLAAPENLATALASCL
ncbi:MAG: phosphotransferase [Phycisphaerales bacterium]|nr:phosphotransferase [Phycisphaerales bacterium]